MSIESWFLWIIVTIVFFITEIFMKGFFTATFVIGYLLANDSSVKDFERSFNTSVYKPEFTLGLKLNLKK